MIYSIATAGCANGGTPTYDSDGNVIGCMLDGVSAVGDRGRLQQCRQPLPCSTPITPPTRLQRQPTDLPDRRDLHQPLAGVGRISGRGIQPGGRWHSHPCRGLQALALGNAIGSFIVPVALTFGQNCNGSYNGVFNGNVTVSAGQNCVLTSPCEIKGNVNVTGGSFALACTVDGNVTISGSSAFILHGASIGNNLQIQSLSAGQPQGAVCGSMIKGNLVVQNNASPVDIGADNANACAGNTVGNNLQVQNNTAATSIDYNNVSGNLQINNDTATTDVSGNTVGNNLQCQNNTPTVTHIALNRVQGRAQGRCAAFRKDRKPLPLSPRPTGEMVKAGIIVGVPCKTCAVNQHSRWTHPKSD